MKTNIISLLSTMPKFGTFHARIKIDAKELLEYDVQINGNEKKVSCWIPSEAGKVGV